jgi:transcriptional regulator GlxA family with amidase domain
MRLNPACGVFLFDVNMHELAGAHVGLDELIGRTHSRELAERTAAARSVSEAADLLQQFLIRLLAVRRRRPHPGVCRAATRILRTRGNVRISALAAEVSISERQLERLFLSEIGVTPKEFASLTRFDWAVRNAALRTSWAGLAIEAGYSDQAHLIRTFAKRAGLTPVKLAAEYPAVV